MEHGTLDLFFFSPINYFFIRPCLTTYKYTNIVLIYYTFMESVPLIVLLLIDKIRNVDLLFSKKSYISVDLNISINICYCIRSVYIFNNIHFRFRIRCFQFQIIE